MVITVYLLISVAQKRGGIMESIYRGTLKYCKGNVDFTTEWEPKMKRLGMVGIALMLVVPVALAPGGATM